MPLLRINPDLFASFPFTLRSTSCFNPCTPSDCLRNCVAFDNPLSVDEALEPRICSRVEATDSDSRCDVGVTSSVICRLAKQSESDICTFSTMRWNALTLCLFGSQLLYLNVDVFSGERDLGRNFSDRAIPMFIESTDPLTNVVVCFYCGATEPMIRHDRLKCRVKERERKKEESGRMGRSTIAGLDSKPVVLGSPGDRSFLPVGLRGSR